MSKYLEIGEKGKRNSKNNLTKGVFGICKIDVIDLKVIPKHLRTSETCNEYGVKGNKIIFKPIEQKQSVPQTKKGNIPSTYHPYKINNKYTPNSLGKVKKNA